jgi:hypothetical protein
MLESPDKTLMRSYLPLLGTLPTLPAQEQLVHSWAASVHGALVFSLANVARA